MYRYYLFCDATDKAVVDARRFTNEADAIAYAWKRWTKLSPQEKALRRFFYVIQMNLTEAMETVHGPYSLQIHF